MKNNTYNPYYIYILKIMPIFEIVFSFLWIRSLSDCNAVVIKTIIYQKILIKYIYRLEDRRGSILQISKAKTSFY